MMIMTQPKPDYKRGDVILVLFPHSDLSHTLNLEKLTPYFNQLRVFSFKFIVSSTIAK